MVVKPRRLRVLWWNLAAPNPDRATRQIDLMLALRPKPDVIALCEVREDVVELLEARLHGYKVFAPDIDLKPMQRRVVMAARPEARELAIDQFQIPDDHSVPQARGFHVRRHALRSISVTVDGRGIEVHAVHIPNGSSNGWEKIDHLWAVRYGLEGRGAPQILCGDFNTPQLEKGRQIITFGQDRDGNIKERSSDTHLYTPERPWDGRAWDAGERAVLEELPRELGMRDVFRSWRPRATGVTWAPAGREHLGRRLDHVFASRELTTARCRHIHEWRRPKVSDHCPIDVTFAV